MHFIAARVLDNHRTDITIQRKHDHILSAQEIAGYDNVLTVESGHLRKLR